MDQIQLVDKAVSEDRIIEFFKSIVRIPSPRFEEEAVARHIGTFMNGMGLKVSFHTVRQADTETIQVVGRYGQNKGGKRVALCAHMDTGSGQYQGLVFQPNRWNKGSTRSGGGGWLHLWTWYAQQQARDCMCSDGGRRNCQERGVSGRRINCRLRRRGKR